MDHAHEELLALRQQQERQHDEQLRAAAAGGAGDDEDDEAWSEVIGGKKNKAAKTRWVGWGGAVGLFGVVASAAAGASQKVFGVVW